MVGKRGAILGKTVEIDDFRVFSRRGIGQKILGPRIFLNAKHISMTSDRMALSVCRCAFPLSRYMVRKYSPVKYRPVRKYRQITGPVRKYRFRPVFWIFFRNWENWKKGPEIGRHWLISDLISRQRICHSLAQRQTVNAIRSAVVEIRLTVKEILRSKISWPIPPQEKPKIVA